MPAQWGAAVLWTCVCIGLAGSAVVVSQVSDTCSICIVDNVFFFCFNVYVQLGLVALALRVLQLLKFYELI